MWGMVNIITKKVRVMVENYKIVEVDAKCKHCGSTIGEVVYGSINIYFKCFNCKRWSILGFRTPK